MFDHDCDLDLGQEILTLAKETSFIKLYLSSLLELTLAVLSQFGSMICPLTPDCDLDLDCCIVVLRPR